jgi:hypothetical protein
MKDKRVVFMRGEGLGVKGRWWPVREPQTQRTPGAPNTNPITTAAITCPDCGGRGMLDKHTITNWGIVNPSVQCDCGFHEMIELRGWKLS